jgi:hypothetical protein
MTRYTHDELVARIKTPGWRPVGKDKPASATLEEVLRSTHRLEAPTLIQEIDTEIELDLIEIQKLWRYLGLPL